MKDIRDDPPLIKV